MTYTFLQHYWWLLVSVLGGLLVFLMFVQGANSLIFSLGHTPEERRLVVNSTGRKWEFTFTTLVTFGGAFFQYQFRWCLLALDGYSVHFRVAGREL